MPTVACSEESGPKTRVIEGIVLASSWHGTELNTADKTSICADIDLEVLAEAYYVVGLAGKNAADSTEEGKTDTTSNMLNLCGLWLDGHLTCVVVTVVDSL